MAEKRPLAQYSGVIKELQAGDSTPMLASGGAVSTPLLLTDTLILLRGGVSYSVTLEQLQVILGNVTFGL